MTVLQKPALFAPKLNSILLPQFTDTLNIYPSPVYQVLNVNWSAFLKGIFPTQWDPWRALIGQWRPVSSPTGCVAHWRVIGHCVGVMAAHGVFLEVVFTTSLPTHPSLSHPTLPCCQSHPPPLLSILTAERDGKKYLEIQPSETEKVSYNKHQ